MVYTRFVEIGRVVLINDGPNKGKIAAIAEVVDANRALLDGPSTGVRRYAENFNNVQLTKFTINIAHGARSAQVKKAWDGVGISQKWESSQWAQKLVKRTIRANLSDFDRFKLMKAKQMRNRIVRSEMKKLKKGTAKNYNK